MASEKPPRETAKTCLTADFTHSETFVLSASQENEKHKMLQLLLHFQQHLSSE